MTTENRKLDMSLDDIIRMDGIKGPRRFNSGTGGGAGGQNRRRFSGGGSGGDRRGRYEPKRLQTGPYNRNRSNGGGGFSNRYGSSGGRLGGRQMNGLGGGKRRTATLHVSNLATSVNTEDIDELFSTFGVLVRSFVHYDQYGTSLGTAEVIFENRGDAMEARNKLNSVPLDGKPLRISVIDGDDSEANDPFSNYLRQSTQRSDNARRNGPNRSNYNSQNNNRNNRNGGGGNRPNNGGGRRGGRDGPQKSAEDLDREMDEWRMQVEDVDVDVKEDGEGGGEEGEFDV